MQPASSTRSRDQLKARNDPGALPLWPRIRKPRGGGRAVHPITRGGAKSAKAVQHWQRVDRRQRQRDFLVHARLHFHRREAERRLPPAHVRERRRRGPAPQPTQRVDPEATTFIAPAAPVMAAMTDDVEGGDAPGGMHGGSASAASMASLSMSMVRGQPATERGHETGQRRSRAHPHAATHVQAWYQPKVKHPPYLRPAEVPGPRAAHSANVIGHTIYVFGGWCVPVMHARTRHPHTRARANTATLRPSSFIPAARPLRSLASPLPLSLQERKARPGRPARAQH